MKVAIYCRVSTEDQKERETIATQRDYAVRYCESQGHTIVEIYEDDGVSATKHPSLTQRRAGARMLEDARAKRFEVVLVYKLDRLGRGAKNVLSAVEELERYVLVQSMTEQFDSATAAGRLLRTIMAGAGEYERDTFVERSTEATNRLAREGQWMGGIVPFGYRVVGVKRDARLEIANELMDGMALSEADVIRLIYRLAAEEGRSCEYIAHHLNSLGVPPAYTRDGREVLRGKRKENTQGIWRYGRIANLLKNTTYKGVHFYGRRSTKKREIIERQVPAIVSQHTWDKAQETLKKNFLFNARGAKRCYLLRGLMKCDLCGLTYIGTGYSMILKRPNKKLGLDVGATVERTYYCCNGKHNGRSLFGAKYAPCASMRVSSDIEDIITKDILDFLQNPGDVLTEIQSMLEERQERPEEAEEKLNKAQSLLREKHQERDRVLTLFRRGRIDDTTLERQLDDIEREEVGIRNQVEALSQELLAAQADAFPFENLEPLLLELREGLEEPFTWEVKRQLIEMLVESITVETHGEGKERWAKIVVVYCFEAPSIKPEEFASIDSCTDVRADNCWGLQRIHRL